MRASLVLLKLPRSCPKRILGNSAIPWQGKTPDSHFIHFLFFFLSVGPPSPTSKIPHWLKFLSFRTCPNCIGRSWNSSTERPERQLHSWTAMFTTEHFRRPSLHETISHLCLGEDQTRTVLTLSLCLQNQLKCQLLENLRMRWWNVWTREKNAVPPDTGAGASYQTSHPGISARAIAFGRSWPFAAFCYRPCLPVRHWGRDMSAPKPYETNPTPTHSSKPPLSI